MVGIFKVSVRSCCLFASMSFRRELERRSKSELIAMLLKEGADAKTQQRINKKKPREFDWDRYDSQHVALKVLILNIQKDYRIFVILIDNISQVFLFGVGLSRTCTTIRPTQYHRGAHVPCIKNIKINTRMWSKRFSFISLFFGK